MTTTTETDKPQDWTDETREAYRELVESAFAAVSQQVDDDPPFTDEERKHIIDTSLSLMETNLPRDAFMVSSIVGMIALKVLTLGTDE